MPHLLAFPNAKRLPIVGTDVVTPYVQKVNHHGFGYPVVAWSDDQQVVEALARFGGADPVRPPHVPVVAIRDGYSLPRRLYLAARNFLVP